MLTINFYATNFCSGVLEVGAVGELFLYIFTLDWPVCWLLIVFFSIGNLAAEVHQTIPNVTWPRCKVRVLSEWRVKTELMVPGDDNFVFMWKLKKFKIFSTLSFHIKKISGGPPCPATRWTGGPLLGCLPWWSLPRVWRRLRQGPPSWGGGSGSGCQTCRRTAA